MKDLFDLPVEFKVQKRLTKEQFLTGANLLQSAKKAIAERVKQFEILYDIKFHDGSEIIVLDVLINYRQTYSTDYDIARMIAQAVPHHCILHVHDDDFGRISVFLTKKNSQNENRRVIEKQTSSPIFKLNSLPGYVYTLIDQIKAELSDSRNTAKKAMTNCVYYLEECKTTENSYKWIYEDKNDYEKKVIKCLEYGKDHPDEVLTNVYYKEFNSDRDNEIAVKLAEEALFKSAFALYSEVSELFEKEDWLLMFANSCDTVLNDFFDVSATNDFYKRLGAAFSTEEYFLSDDEIIYAVEELMADLNY